MSILSIIKKRNIEDTEIEKINDTLSFVFFIIIHLDIIHFKLNI